jgi:hypothetical protein
MPSPSVAGRWHRRCVRWSQTRPDESIQIRQIVAIEVKVVKTGGGEKAHKHSVANDQTNQTALPMDPPHPGRKHFPNRTVGVRS